MAGEGVISDRSGTVAWQATPLNDARSALRLRWSAPRLRLQKTPAHDSWVRPPKAAKAAAQVDEEAGEGSLRPTSKRNMTMRKQGAAELRSLLSPSRNTSVLPHRPSPLSSRKAQATTLDMPTRDGMVRDGRLAKAWQTAGDLNSKRKIYFLIYLYRYAANFLPCRLET